MLAELLHQPADLGPAGDFVEPPDQGRPLGFEQERRQARNDVLDDAERCLVAQADRDEIVETSVAAEPAATSN